MPSTAPAGARSAFGHWARLAADDKSRTSLFQVRGGKAQQRPQVLRQRLEAPAPASAEIADRTLLKSDVVRHPLGRPAIGASQHGLCAAPEANSSPGRVAAELGH
jgi:hypothetical protein